MSINNYPINQQNLQKLNAVLLYISTSRYEGDWQSIPHIHPFSELIYVVNGKGQFLLDKNKHSVSAGDLIIVPPNLEHTEESCPLTPLEYIVLGIDGIAFGGGQGNDCALIRNYIHDPNFLPLLRLLLEEAENKNEGGALICQDLLEILLLLILRAQKLTPVPFAPTKMTKECSLIKRYLDSHFADSITLDQLAALAHMNKYYLAHAFSRYTGLSPISYLNERRMENSRELLIHTDHSIAQIASLSGFSSQSYFAQAFKKDTGVTPAQYRKQHSDRGHSDRINSIM